MIFRNFCEREMIDPSPFRRFIMQTYISGWQIVNSQYALKWAWKDFLNWEYWKLYNKLALRSEK